ncbi:MAG TPA: hypothetical protein PKD52_12260 [Clostridiales bacterium]|nr:hypothetical protein [Clostridiales bacterium]
MVLVQTKGNSLQSFWMRETTRFGRRCFTAFPVHEGFSPPIPIKFFIPAVYFTYRSQKDYKKIRGEWKQTKAEAKVYDDRNIDLYMIYEKDEDKSVLIKLYMTYEKMNELNKLFELANPPEFRITTYEKSGVFISIEPIPGGEYLPEALECMEKINAMYP